MKRYLAIILSAVLVLTCFTACKAKVKEGLVLEGEKYPIATKADGGIQRDENGNLIVMVTDENGKNVKDENGEYKTNPVKMDHAIVIGDRIECSEFALTIPKGWSDLNSYTGVQIQKDNTDYIVKVNTSKMTMDEVLKGDQDLIAAVKAQYKSAVVENKAVEINDEISAQFKGVYVEDTGTRYEDGTIVGMYLGFFVFEYAGNVYNCRISSIDDMGKIFDEIVSIIGTVEFVK